MGRPRKLGAFRPTALGRARVRLKLVGDDGVLPLEVEDAVDLLVHAVVWLLFLERDLAVGVAGGEIHAHHADVLFDRG